jgi:hypothetical protein
VQSSANECFLVKSIKWAEPLARGLTKSPWLFVDNHVKRNRRPILPNDLFVHGHNRYGNSKGNSRGNSKGT